MNNINGSTVGIMARVVTLFACVACSSGGGAPPRPCADMNGTAEITAHTSICPSISELIASAATGDAGTPVQLSAVVIDSDTDVDQLTFVWKVGSGTVADPGAAATTYTCAVGGSTTVELTVSDGTCEDTSTVDVMCPE